MPVRYAYYLVLALSSLSLRMSGPYGVLWMQRGLGLNALFVRQITYAVAQGLLDYPSGGMADKWGRRKTYALGYALLGLNFIVLGGWLNQFTLILSSVLAGAGLALVSGALEAWITDEVARRKQAGHNDRVPLEKIFSRGDSISFAAMALAGLVSSALNWLFGLQAPILVGGGLGLVTAVVTIFLLRENYGGVQKTSYVQVLKAGAGTVWRSKALLSIGLAMLLFHTGYQIFGMLDAPFLSSRGIPDRFLGVLYAAEDAAASLGGLVASRLMPRWRASALTLLASFAWSTGLALLVVWWNPVAVVILYLGLDTLFGLRAPALKTWRNALIPAEIRATILSTLSTITFLGSTLILAAITPASSRIGLDAIILLAAGLAGVSSLGLIAAYRKGQAEEMTQRSM